METQILYAILAVNMLILALNVFFLFRLKLIKYLLEHPVIKKVPGNLKLKPIKINRGDMQKSENRYSSASHSRGDRDNRNRNDRGKNTRSPRGRNGKAAYNRPSNVMSNRASEGDKEKHVSSEGNGVKPKQSRDGAPAETQVKTDAAPAKQPAKAQSPESGKPSEVPANKAGSDSGSPGQNEGNSEIKHGRRVKVKRLPMFDE